MQGQLDTHQESPRCKCFNLVKMFVLEVQTTEQAVSCQGQFIGLKWPNEQGNSAHIHSDSCKWYKRWLCSLNMGFNACAVVTSWLVQLSTRSIYRTTGTWTHYWSDCWIGNSSTAMCVWETINSEDNKERPGGKKNVMRKAKVCRKCLYFISD